MPKQQTINDEDRRDWVSNDEGWYDIWRRSGIGLYRFVKENREEITQSMRRVLGGEERQHALKYGG